jgi:hypothetical protein
MSQDDKGTLLLQPLAVIETVTALDDVRRLLGNERHAAEFRLEPCVESPHGYHWFNVCVDTRDAESAIYTVRSVLGALLDLADRRLVEHFRIVTGADLLRHPPWSEGHGERGGGGPCVA